jgi:hypothetical protein
MQSMATKKRKMGTTRASKYVTADGHTYLTKRTTIQKAQAAGKKAAAEAMALMGYVVVAEGDQIVRKYANGDTQVIAPI